MYVVTGSITTAVRIGKLIEAKSGYPAEVVHTPGKLNAGGGCSYSVRADDRLSELAKRICREYKFRIKGIYRRENHNGESVYNDIS